MPEKEKKQIPLRLSKTLYDELNRWAEDDFRSLNGQIEYLLTEAVRRRKKQSAAEAGSAETEETKETEETEETEETS